MVLRMDDEAGCRSGSDARTPVLNFQAGVNRPSSDAARLRLETQVTQHSPIAFDLAALLARMPEGTSRELQSVLAQTRSLASCARDLANAQDALDALDAIVALSDPLPRYAQSSKEALLYFAVSCYHRATLGGSKKGSRPPIALKLSPKLQAMHVDVGKLRNKALAHVHLEEEHLGSTWHSAMIALVMDGIELDVVPIAMTTDFDSGVVECIAALLPPAQEQVEEKLNASLGELVSRFSELIHVGMEIPATDAVIDLKELFGSRERGEAFLRSRLYGE